MAGFRTVEDLVKESDRGRKEKSPASPGDKSFAYLSYVEWQEGWLLDRGIIPQGGTGIVARSGGTCVVCGEQKSKGAILIRARRYDTYGDPHPRLGVLVAGPKVCVGCSRYTSDEQAELCASEYGEWDWRRTVPLDRAMETA